MGASIKAADGLTPTQRRAVEAFLGEAKGDQTKAWRIANPKAKSSHKSAKEAACRLFAQPQVRAALDAALKRATERELDAGADAIVREMARIGFARISDICQVIDGKLVIQDTAVWPEDIKAAVAEISHGPNGLRVKLHPKEPALLALGKNVGLFKDTVEHTGHVRISHEEALKQLG